MEILAKKNSKNKFGQYFTPKFIAEFMIDLADINRNSKILEPSCGEGVFLECLQERGHNQITAYEIDPELAVQFPFVKYQSFVSANIADKFDLVIGNPPYIRWKNLEEELKCELSINQLWNKYFNSLCDYLYIFILKSIELLDENGQLIFICPEYWMNTTHSISLRNYMVQNGYFEEIYHFNETPIFEKATVSIVIFKYVKSKLKKDKIKVAKFYANQMLTPATLKNLYSQTPLKDAEYLLVPQFKINQRWLLQSEKTQKEIQQLELACQKTSAASLLNLFENETPDYVKIGDVCEIGNGLVSGLDKAFQITEKILTSTEKSATINVVKAKDLKPFWAENITKYIFLNSTLNEDDLRVDYPNFYHHFQRYKNDLEKRYQYNRKINYWEWVFLRNFNLFNKAEKRIFVPCKERISNKNFFRFALVDQDIFPTQDVTAIFKKTETKESIQYIVAYLNQAFIFDWLKCNGIVKGNIVEFSEKPIASIPFRKIDWNNKEEVSLHHQTTHLTQQFIDTKNPKISLDINSLFAKILNHFK